MNYFQEPYQIVLVIALVFYVASLFIRRKQPKFGRIISYVGLGLMIVAVIMQNLL